MYRCSGEKVTHVRLSPNRCQELDLELAVAQTPPRIVKLLCTNYFYPSPSPSPPGDDSNVFVLLLPLTVGLLQSLRAPVSYLRQLQPVLPQLPRLEGQNLEPNRQNGQVSYH